MASCSFASSKNAVPQLSVRVSRPAKPAAPHANLGARPLRTPSASASASPQRSIRAAAATAEGPVADPFAALGNQTVFRVSDGQELPLTAQWGPSDTAVVVFGRTFGCPFCQELATELARDALPRIQASGGKLFFVAIGVPERGRDFAARTGFPQELLFADPENACYDRLGLYKSVQRAFFSPSTPLSLAKRAVKDGGKGLLGALDGWEPWQPPKGAGQALNQGGMFVFEGAQCKFSHYDPATSAHADMDQVWSVLGAIDAAKSRVRECE
ncbi:unnamed protein product [Pedinophyceae sp. YPF-701]|nr:unnamed protein product [Pedinophyceae sp. YPF-701]